MMTNKRQEAIELRSRGQSVKNIASTLGVARGSVSTWVRDVVLTSAQKLALKKSCHSPEVIKKRKESRLKNEEIKKQIAIEDAASSIKNMDFETLKTIGIGLYWGEGAKASKGSARISNSDPMIILTMLRFFREICGVQDEKFRAHIHVHSLKAAKHAEKYWSTLTGIPLSQFFKTYIKKSKSSKNIRTSLQYGTLDVGVCDSKLRLKILGWIEGYKRQVK